MFFAAFGIVTIFFIASNYKKKQETWPPESGLNNSDKDYVEIDTPLPMERDFENSRDNHDRPGFLEDGA